MDVSKLLWKQWHEQVKQLVTHQHGHQKKVLAFCVLGIIVSRSAVLQRMAESLAECGLSQAKMPSIERRLARFVANQRIIVSEVWKQFLEQVLPYWQGKRLYLVLDCTPGVTARSLPIEDSVVCRSCSCVKLSTGITCCVLRRLIPAGAGCVVAGGIGFPAVW